MKIKQIITMIVICVIGIVSTSIYAETYEHFTYTVSNNEVTITGYDGTATDNLVIPDEIDGKPVTKIGDNAFYNCKNITGTLTLSSNLKSIGNMAFYNCSGLTGNLVIPDNVTSIDSFSFCGCTGFDGSLALSSKLKEIDICSFYNCKNLTGTIEIPNSVKTIGGQCFQNSGFEKIIIPSSVNKIDGNIQSGSSIKEILVDENNESYCSVDGVLYNKDKTILIACPSKKSGKINIEGTVKEIGNSAVYNCSNLTGVLELPQGLEKIGVNAFYSSNLSGNLNLPSSLKEIGYMAFGYCENFTGDLIIPDSVTTLSEWTFCYCRGFDGRLKLPKTISKIPGCIFYNCENLKGDIVIPEGVEIIESSAFSGCYGFDGELTLPSTLKEIESAAFYLCSGLTGNLIIPDSVDIIHNRAFLYDNKFESVKINDATETQEMAFSIGLANVTYNGEELYYKGEELVPNVTLTFNNKILEEGVDYIIERSGNNQSVGKGYIGLKGIGVFGDTTSYYYQIYGDTNDLEVRGITDKMYTGMPVYENYEMYFYGKRVYSGEDFTISYEDNIELGKAKLIITGNGNYKRKKEITFNIIPQDINNVFVKSINRCDYTGKEITPDIEASFYGSSLKKGIDYTLSYNNNIRPGTATVVIKGIGNYTGKTSKTFEISKISINPCTCSKVKDYVFNAKEIKPKVTVKDGDIILKEGVDYKLSYLNNNRVGEATVIVNGIGDYVGSTRTYFNIKCKSITDLSFGKINSYVYTGKEIKPNITIKHGDVTLVKDIDYTLTYKNNINVGTATVTVTGKGNYTGTKKFTFKINARKISTVTVNGIVKKTYTGKAIYQGYKLTYGEKILVKGTDFTIKYENNVKVGTATITFKGKGNFTGTLKKTFKITRKSIIDLEYNKIGNRAYTGSEIKPKITIKYGKLTLKQGTDYKITYKNNLKLGTAKIIITGVGNYTGTKEIDFKIVQRDITQATVTGLKNKVYSGKRIGQSLTITYNKKKLKLGTDYTLTYKNNIEVGTAKVIINGIGNFKGTKSLNYKILKK